MKNKFKKLIFLFLLNVFFASNIVGEEIKFEANFIELIDEEKRIIAKKNVKIINDEETIYADEMDYDKSKQIIKAKGNVRIENIEKNIEIFSDELIYFKNKETISLNKNVRINFKNKLLFNTQEVLYDKNKKQIITNNFSTFKDNFGNKISSEKTKYLFDQSMLKINLVKMIDKTNNKYFFENAIIDFKNNEVIGDNVKIDFFKNSFNNKENDPRLRGNYFYSDNNYSLIKKGVFTTCKKRNDKCPPWQFKAQEIKHDKSKRTINYKNAVGNIGTVYVPVPPKRKGIGQIEVQLQGRLAVVGAVTDDEEKIGNRTAVRVKELVDLRTLLVERLEIESDEKENLSPTET